MKTKIYLIGLFILSIGLFSCKKDDPTNNQLPKRPNSITELTATPDFNWQTVKNVKLTIQGSHIMTTTVKTADGNVYFTGMVKPNSKIETTIALPATINELLISYGPFTKVVSIVNNSIDCTFNLNNY